MIVIGWRCRGCIEEAREVDAGDLQALEEATELAKNRAADHAKTCLRGPSAIVGPLVWEE